MSFPPIIGRCSTLLAVAILSTTLASPALASPLGTFSLQELIDGETFTTDSGLLFSDFSADVDLPDGTDAGHIFVRLVENGFALIGPFMVLAGETGRIDLSYTVSIESEALGITAASLSTTGEALGSDAEFEVTESLTPVVGDEQELYNFADAPGMGGASDLFDEVVFSVLPVAIEIQKQILLSGGAHGGSRTGHLPGVWGVMGGWDGAGIELIEQRFDTDVIPAPEPGAFGLLGMGLVGLARLGRRRAR